MPKIEFDVDLDFANRDQALSLIDHTSASIIKNNESFKHNTGVYVTSIPKDILTGRSTLDYKQAEQLGYFKLDFLNVSVYSQINSPSHLEKLLGDNIPWQKLADHKFVEQLVHLSKHFNTLQRMLEPVDSMPRLMMFLALIRPAKRHLIGSSWKQISETIWDKDQDGQYSFKKSHSCAYAHLVTLHMRLLVEQGN